MEVLHELSRGPGLSESQLAEFSSVVLDKTSVGREAVSKALAEAWSKISEKWPAEAGYNPKLIVNHGIPGYYFTVPEEGAPNITDTAQMFYFHPSLSPADVILASWR